MTAIQLNAEMLRNMSIIAEDETLLKRVTKYLRKVVSEKLSDPTKMTKEAYFARIEEADLDEVGSTQQGVRICTSFFSQAQQPLFQERIRAFAADNKI